MFHDYPDSLPIFRQFMPSATRAMMYSFCDSLRQDNIARAHMGFEQVWYDGGKPFYRVWPKIVPMLTTLDISKVPSSSISLPHGLDALLVQLPIAQDVRVITIQNIQTTKGVPGISIGANRGASGPHGVPEFSFWVIEHSNATLSEHLANLPIVGQRPDDDIMQFVVSLAATVCLIGDNPDMLDPVLLSGDTPNTPEDIPRLWAKAKKRGRMGWDVGKTIEVAPHFRRPHPALVWTGSGRRVPKIVMRSGCVVHKSKVVDIPTGYGS